MANIQIASEMPDPRNARLRRTLKIIGLSLGCLIGLGIVAVIALTVVGSIDRISTFSVADAEPVDPGLLDALAAEPAEAVFTRQTFGFAVHRLKPGRGLVLGHRFFSPGDAWAIDDERYNKTTVWLPDGLSASVLDFNLARDSVLVMRSTGGSAWPRNDCSGFVSSGWLQVKVTDGGHEVSLQGQFTPKGSDQDCKAHPITLNFHTKPISFDALTPWLGLPAEHPYQETYRN